MQAKSYHEMFQQAVDMRNATWVRKVTRRPLREIKYAALRMLGLMGYTVHIRAKTFWGEEMLVVMPELVSRAIYHYGYYEEGLTKMVLEYLKPGMVFIDIGAHLGYYTLLASTIVGDAGQVHAFEPTPSTYRILEINTQGRKNVILNRMAVFSSGSSMLEFYDYGPRYSGHNSFTAPRLPKQVQKTIHPKLFKVGCVTLDDYCSTNRIRPSFVKIDAESAEFDVLSGMLHVIQDYHPIISLEVGDEEQIPGVKSSRECVMFLIERGYKACQYRRGMIVEHTLKQKYDYDNLLFINPEQKG